MARTTTSIVQEALQEVYGDMHEQINLQTPGLDIFQDSESMRWDGKVAVESLHYGRNQSALATGETGTLPVAGNQRYQELRIPVRLLYGAIELSGQVMEQSTSDIGKFVDIAQKEVDGMVDDLARSKERIIMGDGRGVLAAVNGDIGGVGVTVIPVKDPGGVVGSDFPNRFFFPNQQLAFYDATGATLNAIRTVVSVAEDGTSITVDSNLVNTDAPDGGFICKGTNRGGVTEGSFGIEPMGIRGIFDDGTFVGTIHGLDRSANPWFKVKTFNVGGALTEDFLHRALNAPAERKGRLPDVYFMHHSTHREFITLSQTLRRYPGEGAIRPDTGIAGQTREQAAALDFNQVRLRLGRYCDFHTIYLVDGEACKKYVLQAGKWADEDGSMFLRLANVDAYEARYRIMENYGPTLAGSSSVMRTLNATVDVNIEAG